MQCVRIVLALLFLTGNALLGADFHVDPENGQAGNNGGPAAPWKSLQDILDAGLIESQAWESLPYEKGKSLVAKNKNAKIKPGDTIWLREGYYGKLTIRGYYNTGPITIAALDGHKPRFREIYIGSSANWTLKGLHVSPEFGEGKKPRTLIEIDSHNFHGPVRDITIEACVLRSADDTSSWSAEDWNQRACSGINANGQRITIRDNRLKNVNFGIGVDASHSLIERNVVENFSGDGLRGLGDYSVFQYNTVKNCYDVNGNHDDGFQSWSVGPDGVGSGAVVGIVLRGNTIINYEDENQPHRGALQGIGCFDGMFVDWVVENNVVVVNHYHGITLLGARDCRIVNNTVLDPAPGRPGPAGVNIGKHKKGMVPSGCLVRNNLAVVSISDGPGMSADHNAPPEADGKDFVNAAAYDFHLRQGSRAIDAGGKESAPTLDIAKTPRPQGRGFDLGAYEYK